MAPIRLSVVDQSPISEGAAGPEALANTLDLARTADRLGYTRYWLAEHHGSPMLAGPAPEVLTAAVAAQTGRIRVGAGGVMLPHYSPLKVAESFSLLAGLYGDRIDLALGRASGTDPITTIALQRDRRTVAPDDFFDQLTELLALSEDRMPPEHSFARHAKLLPGLPERPAPWLLGSSPQSAIWAGELGLPYAFADFISPRQGAVADLYRERFTETRGLAGPEVAVGLAVLCADTDADAERLALSSRMAFTLLREGRLIKVPPVETAERFFESRPRSGRSGGRRFITGSPETVRAGMEEALSEYGSREAIVLTIAHDHAVRRRSYELLASAFGLGAGG